MDIYTTELTINERSKFHQAIARISDKLLPNGPEDAIRFTEEQMMEMNEAARNSLPSRVVDAVSGGVVHGDGARLAVVHGAAIPQKPVGNLKVKEKDLPAFAMSSMMGKYHRYTANIIGKSWEESGELALAVINNALKTLFTPLIKPLMHFDKSGRFTSLIAKNPRPGANNYFVSTHDVRESLSEYQLFGTPHTFREEGVMPYRMDVISSGSRPKADLGAIYAAARRYSTPKTIVESHPGTVILFDQSYMLHSGPKVEKVALNPKDLRWVMAIDVDRKTGEPGMRV